MASIYRRTYQKNGTTREYRTWTAECNIGDRWATLSAFTDRKATAELARNIERLASVQAAGGTPDATLQAFVANLPDRIRKRLAAVGLLAGESLAAGKPLSAHLDDYRQALLDGGASPRQKGPAAEKHANLTRKRVRAILDGIGAKYLHDVQAAAVSRYLAERREAGLSAQSIRHYLTCAKAFFNWMMRENRAATNPVVHLSKPTITTKARRHTRRPLETAEIRRLLESTHSGPRRYGMTGIERATLYRLAIETGLRAGELARLKADSFHLDDDEPHVYLPGDDTKNRQDAHIPLRMATVDILRDYLSHKRPPARWRSIYRNMTRWRGYCGKTCERLAYHIRMTADGG